MKPPCSSFPAECNKTLTALANTEPIAGAQRKEAQSLQWFLSESGWDEREVQERRLELLLEDSRSAPNEDGVLVIDEHGDRKCQSESDLAPASVAEVVRLYGLRMWVEQSYKQVKHA